MTASPLSPMILYFSCSEPACYDKSHLFLSLCSMTLIKLKAEIHNQNPDHSSQSTEDLMLPIVIPIFYQQHSLRLDYKPFCLLRQSGAPTFSLDFTDCFLASQRGLKIFSIRICLLYLIAYACQYLQQNSLF